VYQGDDRQLIDSEMPQTASLQSTNVVDKRINLDQFDVPGNSEDDDFDQVYVANVQSAAGAERKATPPVTPPPGYARQGTPPLGRAARNTPPLAIYRPDDTTPPSSPREENVVINCGLRAVDPTRYRRDYVVGGTLPRHVVKNLMSLRRYVHHITITSDVIIQTQPDMEGTVHGSPNGTCPISRLKAQACLMSWPIALSQVGVT